MARCFLSQNDSFYLESLPIPNFPSPSHHSLYYTDRNGLDEAPNHFQEPKINIYQGFLGRRVLKMIRAEIRLTNFKSSKIGRDPIIRIWTKSAFTMHFQNLIMNNFKHPPGPRTIVESRPFWMREFSAVSNFRFLVDFFVLFTDGHAEIHPKDAPRLYNIQDIF